ncbi:hypothetical protein RHSIM_Rhsim02G0086300 [Rhododendron simsii]|uniref:TAZ-type domain-containing protein n=1 Tax=Rhododendron simsii TaxID=118357 RepID=A0A834HC75_RHOSS|nr:hypothetical protein RHSIM_Rhsim02G0086300 [Rhododendron simsii]
MASPDIDSPWSSPTIESFDGSFNICIDDSESSAFLEVPSSSAFYGSRIPEPPPPPCKISRRTSLHRRIGECYFVPKETKDMWDKLFREGYGADVYVITEEKEIVPAHSSVLRENQLLISLLQTVASPILANYLRQAEFESGIRFIKIPGVPRQAVCMFIRFLYSSCYEEEDMKNFVLHLLVLSHSYSLPSLKRVCVQFLEHAWLTTENVIDVLQLARNCDAPRLSLICVQMIVRDFKTISSTGGWKVMKRANPALEQELLESVVEADSREKERLKKLEEKKVYLQLDEAMEALLHICRDGCGTIGPRDKMLKGSQVACDFPACKGIESLVRHFSRCKIRVPGGCVHCKRIWQLLELHSRMCNDPDYCKVPLCRHFKEKMQQQSKKDEAKWKMLVSKVLAAKNAVMPFSSRQSSFS